MRPGKPLLFARLPDGTPCFGLPGNPVASAVGARLFVDAALRALLGMPPEAPWRLPLDRGVHGKPGFECIQKAALGVDRQGRVTVHVLPGQESFRTRPLLATTVWARVPARDDRFAEGCLVDVHPACHFDQSLLRAAAP
jgi:molybdopterin molybdotransferase